MGKSVSVRSNLCFGGRSAGKYYHEYGDDPCYCENFDFGLLTQKLGPSKTVGTTEASCTEPKQLILTGLSVKQFEIHFTQKHKVNPQKARRASAEKSLNYPLSGNPIGSSFGVGHSTFNSLLTQNSFHANDLGMYSPDRSNPDTFGRHRSLSAR